MKRICIVVSGSIAATPRMLKAADALIDAGYIVRVVDAEGPDWSNMVADTLAASHTWSRFMVRFKNRSSLRFWYTRIRHQLARRAIRVFGANRLPIGLLARAMARVAPELVLAVASEPTDLVYSGTGGGLAVACLAATNLGVPFAVDLEDFHTAELSGPEHEVGKELAGEIERLVLPKAAFLTTSSEPISAAYTSRYSLSPIVIHNVFPLPKREPNFLPSNDRPLTLFWFSQTIGSDRGLEDVVNAITQIRRPIRIRILGNDPRNYLSRLRIRAGEKVILEHIPPCSPERIDEISRDADIGLATEQIEPFNRNLCMTNKLFTYMKAGLALAATATVGQRNILEQVPGAGFLYEPGNSEIFVTELMKWIDNPDALIASKKASWKAACSRWHWEHPLERGALLDAVQKVIGKP